MREAQKLGGFREFATRGRRSGFIDKEVRTRSDYARRRLVGPGHSLKILAVFAT